MTNENERERRKLGIDLDDLFFQINEKLEKITDERIAALGIKVDVESRLKILELFHRTCIEKDIIHKIEDSESRKETFRNLIIYVCKTVLAAVALGTGAWIVTAIINYAKVSITH